MVDANTERRAHKRYELSTRWSVFHIPSGRTFPCRCIDISAGGLSLWAPVSMPVRSGHEVKLMPTESSDDGPLSYISDSELDATVVWVDREPILTEGHIKLATFFN